MTSEAYERKAMKKSLGAKTIVYPTPVFIIGTYDDQGRANAMNAAWGGVVSSGPPAVGVSVRKNRYTYANIQSRAAFTINIPSERHLIAADYFGVVSGADVDKLTAAGLTTTKSQHVDAPIIVEFPFALECRLLQVVEVGVHTQFIGEIINIQADTSALDEKGHLDIERVQPFLFAPGNLAYYGIGKQLSKAFTHGKAFG
jgi:flavin reductase (DIM6/NTAB) family NADH-FMN oxidoreductase RutF